MSRKPCRIPLRPPKLRRCGRRVPVHEPAQQALERQQRGRRVLQQHEVARARDARGLRVGVRRVRRAVLLVVLPAAVAVDVAERYEPLSLLERRSASRRVAVAPINERVEDPAREQAGALADALHERAPDRLIRHELQNLVGGRRPGQRRDAPREAAWGAAGRRRVALEREEEARQPRGIARVGGALHDEQRDGAAEAVPGDRPIRRRYLSFCLSLFFELVYWYNPVRYFSYRFPTSPSTFARISPTLICNS